MALLAGVKSVQNSMRHDDIFQIDGTHSEAATGSIAVNIIVTSMIAPLPIPNGFAVGQVRRCVDEQEVAPGVMCSWCGCLSALVRARLCRWVSFQSMCFSHDRYDDSRLSGMFEICPAPK